MTRDICVKEQRVYRRARCGGYITGEVLTLLGGETTAA
jgi:hypothetical protein